jgi:hypothetical protein
MATVTVWVLVFNLMAWDSGGGGNTPGGATIVDNIASEADCKAAITELVKSKRLTYAACFPLKKVRG